MIKLGIAIDNDDKGIDVNASIEEMIPLDSNNSLAALLTLANIMNIPKESTLASIKIKTLR